MLLLTLAVLLIAWGFVAKYEGLGRDARRRLIVIGVPTAAAAILFSWLRLPPLAILALLVGTGLGANVVMRERSQKSFEDLSEDAPPPRPRRAGMERSEALAILGLKGDPAAEEIRAAHKRMIVRAHPDQGGSDYMAAKVNEARKVLLPES